MSSEPGPKLQWRDLWRINPAAELMPRMSDDELVELAADIKANGIREEIVLFEADDGEVSVLDGISRLDAATMAGLPIVKDGQIDLDVVPHRYVRANINPESLVLSLNVHRRHLTSEKKRAAIAALLRIDPAKSDRAIGRELGVDNKTVASARADLERFEEIPQIETRTDKRGRQRPARKSRSAKQVVAAGHGVSEQVATNEGEVSAQDGARGSNHDPVRVKSTPSSLSLCAVWECSTPAEQQAFRVRVLKSILAFDEELTTFLDQLGVGRMLKICSPEFRQALCKALPGKPKKSKLKHYEPTGRDADGKPIWSPKGRQQGSRH